MRGLLLLSTLTLLLQACGATSGGAPDAGGSGPDSGVPAPSSLSVSPHGQRVLAGAGAITLQATLVGDAPLPIGWALVGPGRLGAVSGPATTYTPPETIAAETVVTVTASAGPDRSRASTGSPASPSSSPRSAASSGP